MSHPAPVGKPLSGPERLQQMHFSFAAERVLVASLQLKVFSHIAAGKQTAPEIALAASASPRGMRMLLDALVGFELLSKRDGRYALSPDAARYLVEESPDYMGAFLKTEASWNSWTHLADVVRTGKPIRSASDRAVAEEFFPTLVRTLHITHSEPARRLAAHLAPADADHGLRILDIGCGSAVWSIALAKRDPRARVTAMDMENVLRITREYAQREGVAAQFDYLPGDLRTDNFPAGDYDLAILGNIVHGENEATSRNLFTRIYRALVSGGRLAIIDMIPNDERTGPPFPLLFALNMLVHTDEGSTYTLAEYRDWLHEAGFPRVETVDIASHSPVIMAAKTAT